MNRKCEYFLKKMAKNHDLKIWYSAEERKKIQKKAESLGLKSSQYIRMVSLNAPIELIKTKEKKK